MFKNTSLLLVLVSMCFVACRPQPTTDASAAALAAADAAHAAAGAFKAEQVVSLSDDAYGCQLQSDVITAMEHFRSGEFSAWGAALGSDNFCFNGADPTHQWTVYQTDGFLVQVGMSTAAQYEAAKDDWRFDVTKQYWVPEHLVVLVK